MSVRRGLRESGKCRSLGLAALEGVCRVLATGCKRQASSLEWARRIGAIVGRFSSIRLAAK